MVVEQKTVMETVKSNPLNLVWTDLDLELKTYAKEHHVPIIVDEGLALLEQIIRIAKPKHILEIGTAIGYSAIRMARICGSKVTTIERDSTMITMATKTIERSGYQDFIQVVSSDALEAFDLVKDTIYDLIFIDAAKAQYQNFFNLYTPLLSSHGIVVSDNMSFHGLVREENLNAMSRSVRGLVRKLSRYQDFILNHPNYHTSIFELGDGVAISVKKD